jgi:hypothetical protein
LNSDTQYITTTPNLTTFSNNVETDDIKVNNVYNKVGSTFIDMTDATDINISATNLTFNSDDIVTTPMYSTLDGGNNDISNVDNLDANSYLEGGVNGELLKTKNTSTLYAGAGALALVTSASDSICIGNGSGANITDGIGK